MSNVEKEVIELLKKVEKLNEAEREVMRYFVSNVSVGDIRATLDLKAKGIDNPEKIIAKLVKEGLLEKGDGCFNLNEKLRPRSVRKMIQI